MAIETGDWRGYSAEDRDYQHFRRLAGQERILLLPYRVKI
jgi:hypothetical protein